MSYIFNKCPLAGFALHQFKRNKELLALFEAVDEQGLGLGRYSYAWVIVAHKRSGRPSEALAAAAEFSKRGLEVRTPFSRDSLPCCG